MSIVYHYDNSQESEESFKRTVCPICNQGRQSNANDVFDCSKCGSTLVCDGKITIRIRHNNVKLRITNLIYGVLTLIVSIMSVVIYNINHSTYTESLGIMFITFYFLIFIKLLFWNPKQFQGFIDLHKALITFRIRYYDWGSKVLIFSILTLVISSIYQIISN